MASNYSVIREENKQRYGTDIGRYGPMLLSDRYDDRTHFIYELLQNAEDALTRRTKWNGSRAIKFDLTMNKLRVSHYGAQFDESDVRGICGIAQSTKGLTEIGRFGIGFKSVYAFTDRPEVHSGVEDFAIENFVWPVPTSPINRDVDETVITLTLKSGVDVGYEKITEGLKCLGPRTLLFLQEIEEISWNVQDGLSGNYLRRKPEALGDNVSRITVIGEEEGKAKIEETWLVFSRSLNNRNVSTKKKVELAFKVEQDKGQELKTVKLVGDSTLVVYFPTVVPTYLGFLVQGPFRTTPSRDNVPRSDEWNQYLVKEIASLLIEALQWLRDNDKLDAAVLHCLPLDREKFQESNMLAPLFEVTRQALISKPLLPRFEGGYVAAANALFASSQKMRKLFEPNQLVALFEDKDEIYWLSDDITTDRNPDIRKYITDVLGVKEIQPRTILKKMSKAFLERQSDRWIRELYEFLKSQKGYLLRQILDSLPLIRLKNGEHVVAKLNDQPQAFLPSKIVTDFPLVRSSVCDSEEALQFLESLGLTEPDSVDDIIRNVLPKYQSQTNEKLINNNEYEDHIHRMIEANSSDSKKLRDKLIGALQKTAFVMSVDVGNGLKQMSRPDEVYLATGQLRQLFEDVEGVLIVDSSNECLIGEKVRTLLLACGAARYLQPVSIRTDLTYDDLRKIRRNAGLEKAGWEQAPKDFTLRGLQSLINLFPHLDTQARQERSKLLWESLTDIEKRRGREVFFGEYHWSYSHQSMQESFDAAFLRQLNETAWVSDSNGKLMRPDEVFFETLGWEQNHFLQSKINFKPQIIETLAREVGIEPSVLDLLKEYDITSEVAIRKLLNLKPIEKESLIGRDHSLHLSDDLDPISSHAENFTSHDVEVSHKDAKSNKKSLNNNIQSSDDPINGDNMRSSELDLTNENKYYLRPESRETRQFISYIGVHSDEVKSNSERMSHQERMELEEKAIRLICIQEPQLQRTPPNNPGYDLYEVGVDNFPRRYIEVKAMRKSLDDHPVGLSHTQFDFARKHGQFYWLYIVEYADSKQDNRVLRIQNPAGKAKTFTFDLGWREVVQAP